MLCQFSAFLLIFLLLSLLVHLPTLAVVFGAIAAGAFLAHCLMTQFSAGARRIRIKTRHQIVR